MTASRTPAARRGSARRGLVRARIPHAAFLSLLLGAGPLLAEPASPGLLVSPGGGAGFVRSTAGTYLPGEVDYLLSNPGFTAIQWDATVNDAWLSVAPASGTLDGVSQETVHLSIVPSVADALAPGTHSTTLVVRDLTNGTSTTRNIDLTVSGGGPRLRVLPTSGFSAGGPAGGPFVPSSKSYVVENTGNAPLSWSASTGLGWLTLSPTAGSLAPGARLTLRVAIDGAVAAGLGFGSHTGSFTVRNDTNGDGDVTISARLDVVAGPAGLTVTPVAGLSSSGPQGGPFAPVSRTYTLSNDGGVPLSWSASADEPWVSVSPAGGALGSGGTRNVVVRILGAQAGLLGPGTHTASVSIVNDTNGLGSTTRSVQLDVMAGSAGLHASPASGLSSAGPVGGPFVPDEKFYTLRNTGSVALSWSASADAGWVLLSSSGGALAPGAEVSLFVAIDRAAAGALSAGAYSATVDVENLTNGSGSTSRRVDLVVSSTGTTLSVSPPGGLTSTGPAGGPFAPPNRVYTLRNASASPLAWSASADRPWIRLSSSGGTLPPMGLALLTVHVDEPATTGLALGLHEGTVSIRDLTGGGAETREVQLTISSSAPLRRSSISQYGITWTFDGPYTAGRFANGDWWVEGPVTIVGIAPPSSDVGGRVKNGSMVNPDPTSQRQGYDSSMYAQYAFPNSYDPELNVALDVSPSQPLVLAPASSLVSTVSRAQPGLRPQLRSAAVLTVLKDPAAPGSFRPAYCGQDKTVRFHEGNLAWSKLERLDPVASTPSLSVVERWFERPWIDHIPDWIGRYHHPSENMPDYGREMCDQVGIAALMLHLDFTDAEKRDLLVRFVQLGIDFHGVVEAGGKNNWPAGGGHHSGRKWPILFAGLMLSDVEMSLIGFDPEVAFNEDDQTFYVQETSPGVYNHGFGGYGPQHDGLPEWGNQHAKNLGQDDVEWFGNAYRICCTAHVWWGEILAAHIMGASPLWNHDALFDYQDRYLQTALAKGQTGWTIAWSQFQIDMWNAYRPNY